MAANLDTRSLTPCVKRPPKQSVSDAPLASMTTDLPCAVWGSNRLVSNSSLWRAACGWMD
jgi:hypothetical protein